MKTNSLQSSRSMQTDYPYLSSPPDISQLPKSIKAFWAVLLSALIGGIGAYALFSILLTPSIIRELKSINNIERILIVGSLPFAAWVSVVFHEAGHLIAAALVGMKPVFLLAGPLKISFEAPGFHPSLNKSLATWGGLALAIPIEGKSHRWMLPAMIAGGPLGSIVLATVTWILAMTIKGPCQLSLGLVSILSSLIALGTLVPIRSGGFDSDGAQLLQIARGSLLANAKYKISIVVGESISGIRPREWSIHHIEDVLPLVSDPLIRVTCKYLLVMAAEDGDDLGKITRSYEIFAKQLHEGGLQAYPAMLRNDLIFPIAIFIAEQFKDAGLAERWMALCNGSTYHNYMELYAKAALSKANGQLEASRTYAKKAIELLPKNGGISPKLIERLRGLATQ